MIALIDRTGSGLRLRGAHALARSVVHCFDNVEQALPLAELCEAVVIGPGQDNPLAALERLRAHATPVVLARPPKDLVSLAEALAGAENLPEDLNVVSSADPDELSKALQNAIQRTRSRRQAGGAPMHPALEAAPVGLLIADRNGLLRAWNRRAGERVGCSLLGAGAPLENLFLPEYRDSVRRLLLSRGEFGYLDVATGNRRFELRASAPPDPTAEDEVLVVVLDITLRHLAEQQRDLALRGERQRSIELQHSKALLDSLLHNAPVGIGHWDRDLRCQQLNRALAEMMGMPESECQGRTLQELIPDVADQVSGALDRVMQTGAVADRLEITTGQGDSVRAWEVSLYPVQVNGETVGGGAIWEEITSRRKIEAGIHKALEREQQARAEAEAAERRAEYLAQAATFLASSLDYRATLQGVAHMAVPQVADWASIDMLQEDGSVRRLVLVHQNPEVSSQALELTNRHQPSPAGPLWQSLRTGEPFLCSDVTPDLLRRLSRSPEHLSTLQELNPRSYIVVPIRLQGRTLGGITLMTAESGRRYGPADLRLAEELASRAAIAVQNSRLYEEAQTRRAEAEAAAAQLLHANQELEQFAYLASHDLQEPLRTVTSFAQLLERQLGDDLSPNAREYMGFVVEGARRMSYLIRDLLEYSRVTRDEQPAGGRVEVAAAIRSALESLRSAIAESQAEISLGEMPVLPNANAAQMQQLFLNLLSNSIKYRQPEVPPRISVAAVREEGRWRFLVADNGQGINPEFIERIFGVFKRLHGRDVPGTGIGLALCRRIVERHRGQIWAEAAPGGGSVFHFTIPD